MITEAYLIGGLDTVLNATGSKEILKEQNETISHFILKVNDDTIGINIDLDHKVIFKIKSISDMVDMGMTKRTKWSPYVYTYDPTNSIYILMWEPDIPMSFSELTITANGASGSKFSYSFEALFLKNVVDVDIVSNEAG